MKILRTLRKPYLPLLLASLVLVVSCTQYENLDNNLLDQQTIVTLQNATLDFIGNHENFEITSKIEQGEIIPNVDEKIVQAINRFASDDLVTFKESVIAFSNWNRDQLISIEASFIVLETMKIYFDNLNPINKTINANLKAAWWAPIAFAGLCTVVGVLTVGIAGAACGILFATAQALANK